MAAHVRGAEAQRAENKALMARAAERARVKVGGKRKTLREMAKDRVEAAPAYLRDPRAGVWDELYSPPPLRPAEDAIRVEHGRPQAPTPSIRRQSLVRIRRKQREVAADRAIVEGSANV